MSPAKTSAARGLFSTTAQFIRRTEDLRAAYAIAKALGARATKRSIARFRASPVGARVLAARQDLPGALTDQAALARLPKDSLGHAYQDFMCRENLSIEGLRRPSSPATVALSDDESRILDRLSVLHDLGHVVTGYGREMEGEICLLAFTCAQTRHPGLRLILMISALRLVGKGRCQQTLKAIAEAYRRGRTTPWLGSQDWEELLLQPIARVRAALNLKPAMGYEALRLSKTHGPQVVAAESMP